MLFVTAVLFGAAAPLWNPVAAGLHDRLQSAPTGKQDASTGTFHIGPE